MMVAVIVGCVPWHKALCEGTVDCAECISGSHRVAGGHQLSMRGLDSCAERRCVKHIAANLLLSMEAAGGKPVPELAQAWTKDHGPLCLGQGRSAIAICACAPGLAACKGVDIKPHSCLQHTQTGHLRIRAAEVPMKVWIIGPMCQRHGLHPPARLHGCAEDDILAVSSWNWGHVPCVFTITCHWQ